MSAFTLPQAIAYVEETYGIKLSPPQLYNLYESDRGPEAFKVGKRIYLTRRGLDDWIESEIETSSRGGHGE
jgi:hypothetical protein